MTLSQQFKRFAKDTGGAVALWGVIATPVLVGGAALSVDASRLYNMDHDLQSASDALARAGAAELDQRSDSMQRAGRAIQHLVSNDQKFAKAGYGEVGIDTIRYLKSLPPNDYDAVTNDHVTYNPAEAKYVEVKVTPQDVATMFPTSIIQKMTDTTLSAKSVAGFDQSVCGAAPVFICNPFEHTETTIYEAMEDPEFRRRQVKFKTPQNQYGPGNFGWLDPFEGNSGASKLRYAIAVDIPAVCMSKSAGVRLRPGNISSMRHGVNTRFDIYKGPLKSKKNDPRYAPAANVVKGYSEGNKVCKESPDNNAMGLPRDKCFSGANNCNNYCADETQLIGKGDWDFVEYMKVNHNYMSPITIEGVTYNINYNSHKSTPKAPPSRYAMYRWEIDNFCVPGALTYGNSANTPEEGLPQCHSYGPSTTVEDRRIIQVAVLNCGAIEDSGEAMSGRTDPLPVETFVKVFLTEPMGKGQDNILYGEVVGPVVQGQDAESKDMVALAR